MMRGVATILVLAAAAVGGMGCALRARVPRAEGAPPKPRPIRAPSRKAIDRAVGRGIAFLVEKQNRDGSWGSARRTKGLNIYAPVPGAHHAFRGAVTALCVSALIETGDASAATQQAIDRGEVWLEATLPRLRRATPAAIYNNWGHAYGIQALVRMIRRRPDDAARRARLEGLIREQIGLLGRYETADGGWGYYDFKAHTKKPSGSPTSFLTATVLVAFREARDVGVEAPKRLVDRALAALRRQRNPDHTYLYSAPWKWRPVYPINRPGGSLGRSQACNVALRLWGEPDITDDVLETWLDRLFARNDWLGIGRKRPVPHESWFQVAGYFYYYGHYYAGLCIDQLPPADRPHFQAHLAATLLRLQEKDGSWWDYPLYDYHQPYGTAFGLMSLVRCR